MKKASQLSHKILNKALRKFGLISFNKELEEIVSNLSNKYGYLQTKLAGKPIDNQEKPIPWFTYPAIEFIEQFDLKEKSIFEWGAGNSSLFFSQRCKKIVSIESKLEWVEYLTQSSDENHEIHYKNRDSFAEAIYDFSESYDIIIIDSLKRHQCAVKAIHKLNEGGLIILDNSDWFHNTSEFLRNSGLLEIDMHGFGPINGYSWTTSFYFHRQFSFPILEKNQPSYSKAAIEQTSSDDIL